MLEGVYVDTIWKHDTIRPYPPKPQEVSGITIGQGAIYRYSLPESDYPTLIIAETIYDDDNNYISAGYYGLALNDEKNFFILIQGGRPIAIFPVFKVEEDANEHARLNDKKYKKELTETITKKTGIQNVTFGTCSHIGKDNAEYYVNFKSDDGKNVYSVIKRNKDITVSVN